MNVPNTRSHIWGGQRLPPAPPQKGDLITLAALLSWFWHQRILGLLGGLGLRSGGNHEGGINVSEYSKFRNEFSRTSCWRTRKQHVFVCAYQPAAFSLWMDNAKISQLPCFSIGCIYLVLECPFPVSTLLGVDGLSRSL